MLINHSFFQGITNALMMNERFGFYPEKLLGAPVVVCGELLEGNVALKVFGAVALRPRQTTGRLKISVKTKLSL